MAEINPFYLGTFVVYLLIVLAIGLWGYTQTSDVMDFWAFGQEMGPWLATWSFVANFVSAVSVIGFIGAVYGEGYTLMTHTIFGLMLGTSALYFAVDRVRNLDLLTFPDIIASVTGYQVARPIAGTVLLGNGWLYLVMQLVGASLLVTTITGVPYEYMVWVIGIVFIAYTVLGGLISVAWTDFLQGTLMVGAVLLALGYMIFDLGGLTSINQQFASLNAANVHPTGQGAYTAIGIIATIVAFFGTIFTEQNNIVRIAATKNVRAAKIHLAAAGVILSVFYSALVILGGATTVALDSNGMAVQTQDAAFPALITNYVPSGVGVIIILAVMSAILSTTDTRLHSTGITTARDIYSYFRPDSSDDSQLKVSRVATIVFGITATAAAVNPPGTIIELYNFRAVLLTSAFLIPVYLGLYWVGLSGRAILASVVTGAILGVATEITGGLFGIPSTFIGVGAATLVLVVGHMLLGGSEPKGGAMAGD
ncbi:sodium:solute symporter family protein [Halorarum halophilum]|uniref:Sodium:solute symporter family protein n=1 Tax=Halorarum halophilum TaxID=2743090 RepID=A0A7D5KNX0_9EURY|nr:sodium:solute symporter family protein [Halobaculum halophilum]QLG28882.1 sodium:solute symporter family protein [Halobaculum halophilum]